MFSFPWQGLQMNNNIMHFMLAAAAAAGSSRRRRSRSRTSAMFSLFFSAANGGGREPKGELHLDVAKLAYTAGSGSSPLHLVFQHPVFLLSANFPPPLVDTFLHFSSSCLSASHKCPVSNGELSPW